MRRLNELSLRHSDASIKTSLKLLLLSSALGFDTRRSAASECGRRENCFHLHGENAGIPVGNAPSILDKDFTITAEVTIPEGGGSGMIVTMGGVSAAMDSTYSAASRFSITTS